MTPAQARFGKYIISREIGQGGFATVYRATDTSLEREVALKILSSPLLNDPTFVANFRQEARTQAYLRHPAIVTIYEADSLEGRLYIAMELIYGPNLAHALRTSGARPWEAALALLKPIVDGLDYAHDQNIIHCDLKPSNILIDPQRGPLLSDFGFARLTNQSSTSSRLSSRSLSPAGTPAYVAPEIWDNQAPSRASDVYALGCIAYEILTGKVLFDGSSVFQILRLHDQGPNLAIPWPAGVPAEVSRVLATALAREPSERYQSAGAFWQALHDLGAATRAMPVVAAPVPAPNATTTKPPARAPRPTGTPRRRWITLVAGLALAGLLVTGVWAGFGTRPGLDASSQPPLSPGASPSTALVKASHPTQARTAVPTTAVPTTAVPTTAVPTTAAPTLEPSPASQPTLAPTVPTAPPPSPAPPSAAPAPARTVAPKPTSAPAPSATPKPPTPAPTDPPAASGAVLSTGRGSYFQGTAAFGAIDPGVGAGGSCIEGRIRTVDGGTFKSFGLLVDQAGNSREPKKDLANGTYRICGLSAGEWGVAIYAAGGLDLPTDEQAAHQVRVRLSGTPGEICYINFTALVPFSSPTEAPKPQASPYDGEWSGTLSGTTTTGTFTGRFRMEVRSNAVYRISIDGPSCIFETYPNFPDGQPISGGAFALSGNPTNPQTGINSSLFFNVNGSFSSSTRASGRLNASQNGTGCVEATWSASR